MKSAVKSYLLNYLYVQLVITLVSLPILISWGLSLSFLSLLGNLIFTPVLMLFIMLSTIFFFSQLVGIPNEWSAFLLTQLTHAWDSVLHFSHESWQISFVHPGTWFLISIPCITWVVVTSPLIKSLQKRIAILSILLLSICTGLWIYQHIKTKNIDVVSQVSEKFSINVNADGQLTFIDDGYFNSKQSPEKVVEFELRPYMAKHFGTPTIKELILLRPGIRSFTSATTFCQYFNVKKVTFPYFEKPLSKPGWRAFFGLKRLIDAKNIMLARTGTWQKNDKKITAAGESATKKTNLQKALSQKDMSKPNQKVATSTTHAPKAD